MKTGWSGKLMNLIVFLIGIALVCGSVYNYLMEKNAVKDALKEIITSISCNSVSVALPSGINLEFTNKEEDRKIAWDIFVQIRTRIAAVEFKKGEDSFLDVNQSLFDLFKFIREKIQRLPLKTVSRDKSGCLVEFYLGILNEGIRPYLTKWHIPVSHFHEKNKDKGISALDIDSEFVSGNPKIVDDIIALNRRMKQFSVVLERIAKGEEFSEKIENGIPVIVSTVTVATTVSNIGSSPASSAPSSNASSSTASESRGPTPMGNATPPHGG